PGADSVAAAEQRLLAPVLVHERRVERPGVLRPEVEDVADLDRRAELQRAAAHRAAIALARLADVGEPGLVVATRRDAANMPAVPVRARDELPLAERLVRQNLAAEADGAERAAARTERLADLVVSRRTLRAAPPLEELRPPCPGRRPAP